MSISIFPNRWYGIKGETVGEGKFAMSVVRVQTSKDGPWQALNDKELEQLIAEHNENLPSNAGPSVPAPNAGKQAVKAAKKKTKGKKK